jgi:hypothetical protein
LSPFPAAITASSTTSRRSRRWSGERGIRFRVNSRRLPFGATDVQVSYFDGDNGNLLKTFALSSRAGHILEENEVYQINNLFADPAVPGTTTKLVVELKAVTSGVYVSGYGVQLDNTTQDGAFFFFEEE